ncbi:TetR/AcrR family transcriptional regulator C-terminal domain-containing protein [Streptomyces sp. MA5143a]|uniref:TetR/AcrR family transcriptional regulator C-terminal domain-containing protein n=1 Tax=Streptomyces sp. MA5143a TaxID=2083010 RepID=UPI000D1A14D2|nr:TetR family transcriptional regulator [Streptomyces sp. MA5143a]SPF02365.1 Tetracycline repressor protein class H [Streptomyces sp. MA5143a]
MATRTRRSQRRTEALSRERIVEAAIELLDAAGEGGLTFRALSERLATGPGAIYWHVENKGELLDAVTDAVVADAVAGGAVSGAAGAGEAGGEASEATGAVGALGAGGLPGAARDGIRAVALGLFDAIEEHPWLATQLATQLSRSPWGTVAPRLFESIGRQVRALGVPQDSWFTATSALMHYILGAAGQNAANSASSRALPPDVDRDQFLDTVSTAWEELDPDEYPFTRSLAPQLRGHDDREQFLAGITLILAGITVVHPPAG